MLPRLIAHMEISLDGKISGFAPDMGNYYRLAESFSPDAMISGSDTILQANMPDPVPEWCFEAARMYESCSRMVLAVVDTRGRVKNWTAIRKQPFWKNAVSICSKATPDSHIKMLSEAGVETIVAGEDRADLRLALETLNSRYGVETVRIDSGGALTATMLSLGLVDEISILLSPVIVGPVCDKRFLDDLFMKNTKPMDLELISAERIGEGVWIRYKIESSGED